MKKVLALFVFFLAFSESNAQSENDSPSIINVTPGFGIFQINDSYVREKYNARGAINWDLGLEFGTQTSAFQFFVKFNRFRVQSELDSSRLDSVVTAITSRIEEEKFAARRNQIAAGIRRFEKISDQSYITFSSAITYNMVLESSRDIEVSSPGLLIGSGYQYRSNGVFSYHVRLSYEYNAFAHKRTRHDWSGLNLTTGISINLQAHNQDSGKAKQEDFINP